MSNIVYTILDQT